MLPYFLVAGVTTTLTCLNTAAIASINNAASKLKLNKSRVRWFILDFFIIVVLVAFSALRFEVGTDYINYVLAYDRLVTENWMQQIAASPQEFGYVFLSLTLKQFSESPQLLFWATSTITIVPAYVAIKKTTNDFSTAIILYILLGFYLTPFNTIRQGMAVSLNFLANTFIDKNKKVFIIINLVAASLHATALYAAIIQWLIRRFSFNIKSFSIIALVTSLAFIFPFLWTWVAELSERTSDRYAAYLEGNEAGLGTYLVIAARLALTLYVILLGRSAHINRYAIYSIVGVAFLVLGTQSLVISRMSDYFSIFLLVLIPRQLEHRRDKFVHLSIIFLAGIIYFWLHISNWGDLIPYQIYS